MPGVRFFLTTDEINSYEADKWEHAQLSKVADTWEQNTLDRLSQQYAPQEQTSVAADTTIMPPPEFQSLSAQTRNPMGGWSDTEQERSSGDADATIWPFMENQSLQAIAHIANENANFGKGYSGVLRPDANLALQPVVQPPVRDDWRQTPPQVAPPPKPTDVAPVQPTAIPPGLTPSSPLPTDFGPVPRNNPVQPTGGLADVVRQAAQRYGIDPTTALRVAQSEGGLAEGARAGDSGSSFGPFQLHYGNVAGGGNAVAGLGDEFTRQTGLDARDPRNVPAAIDFALNHASQQGWGAFHGAARTGVGNFQGIGTQDPDKVAALASGDWQKIANAQLGKPYIWGSAGGRSDFSQDANGFDCSGFVSYVWRNGLNLNLPAFTGDIQKATVGISRQEAQPGDLVMLMNSPDPTQQHVGIYIGNGQMINSTGGGVQVGAVWNGMEFRRDPRLANQPGGRLEAVDSALAAAQARPATEAEQARGEQARKTLAPEPDETTTNPFGEAFRQVGAVKDRLFQEPAGMPASMQPTPSDTLTNPLGTGNAPQSSTLPRDENLEPVDTRAGLPTREGPAALPALDQAQQHLRNGDVQGAMDALDQARQAVATSSVGPALGMLRGPALLSDEELLSRARPEEISRARDLLTKMDPAQPVTDADVANHLRTQQEAFAVTMTQTPLGAGRFYHGTGGAFDRPNAARFDPDGLYGPGYYLTDNPLVAGGIVSEGGESAGQVIQPGYAQMAGRQGGANVRAVDVPQDLRLLDIQAPVDARDIHALRDAAQQRFGPAAAENFLQWLRETIPAGRAMPTGDELYRALSDFGAEQQFGPRSRTFQGAPMANQLLGDAGFDGIRHTGGLRQPISDASGVPIQHNVTVVFPDSLDKLRNAISGQQGGQIAPRLATTLAGGAAGGVTGYETTPPDAGPLERAGRTLGGVALGAAGGYGLGGALGKPGVQQALRTRQRAEGINPLVPDTVPAAVQPRTGPSTQGSTANDTLLNMYGRVKTEPPTAVPSQIETARRFIVREWTDRGVDLAEFQKVAERAAGRPLTADEMAYEMRRLNPAGAADIRIQNELKPAIQSVGEDANWLKVYLTHQDNIDVGKAMGNVDRSFSGGLSAADSEAGLADMAQQLGPARMAKIEQSANDIWDFGRSLLQRKVDSGLISQDLYDELVQQYPHYSPTRIVDYLKDSTNIPSGRKISVQSAGLKRNTLEGTVRQREDPIASFVRSAHETEALATKNEVAQAFLKLRDLTPDGKLMIREVADDLTAPRGFEKMKVFADGEPQSYMMPDYIARAIKEEPVQPIPILTPMMNLFRMLATQRNPLFLASNALNDAASFMLRSSSRLGGPQNAPKVAIELLKAYGDTFQGVFSGEYRGNTQRFIQGGGGMSGFFSRRPEDAARVANELQRSNAFQIRPDHVREDLGQIITQALTLKPVEAIGERIELAPRVAAMRLAEKAGATPQQAVLAGRSVTIDFSQGGTWAKTLNQVIPFFNVAVQSGAQIPRAFAENPRGFVGTAIGLLAAPTVAFEAWNRSDPQRARDYEDVPQYVKDSGLVFMLPTPDQTDEKGNRKPQYAFFPLREYSPFAVLTREAAGRAMGQEPRGWADLLTGTAKSVSPVQGTSGADVISTGVPLGVSTAMQLATDRDWYRNSRIISANNDDQASALSHAISDALNKMGAETRPSAVEFGLRDVGAGVGGALLAGSDFLAGKGRRDQRIQSTPGAGGLIGRFVQDRTGERLNRALDQPVPVEIEKAYHEAGLPTPSIPQEIRVKSKTSSAVSPPIELRQAERAEYQRLMVEELNKRLRSRIEDPIWQRRPIDNRNDLLSTQLGLARDRVEDQLYAAMEKNDRDQRMQAGRLRQQPKPKP